MTFQRYAQIRARYEEGWYLDEVVEELLDEVCRLRRELNFWKHGKGDVPDDPVEISRQTGGDVSMAATKSELSEPGRPVDPLPNL